MIEYIDLYPDELLHYGVKGMRWGVITEDEGSSRAKAGSEKKAARDKAKAVKEARRDAVVERKAKRFESKARVISKEIDRLETQKYTGATAKLKEARRNKSVSKLDKEYKQALQDAQRKRDRRLTSNQKKMLIGAAVVGGLVAAKVIETKVNSGEFRQFANKGKSLFGSEFSFKRKESLMGPKSVDDILKQVVAPINPAYSQNGMGSRMNCRRCTFAYELRRRGYDVQATRTTNASGQTLVGVMNALRPGEEITETSKRSTLKAIESAITEGASNPLSKYMIAQGGGTTNISRPTPKGIFEALSKQPNGARGELTVGWKVGGGHSVAWEIIAGKVTIFDNQTGEHYTSPSQMKEYVLSDAGFTRLDNLPLNMDYLERWVKNAD